MEEYIWIARSMAELKNGVYVVQDAINTLTEWYFIICYVLPLLQSYGILLSQVVNMLHSQ